MESPYKTIFDHKMNECKIILDNTIKRFYNLNTVKEIDFIYYNKFNQKQNNILLYNNGLVTIQIDTEHYYSRCRLDYERALKMICFVYGTEYRNKCSILFQETIALRHQIVERKLNQIGINYG